MTALEPGMPVTVDQLVHALDNSTPYPIEMHPKILRHMAGRLLTMLSVSTRPEHPVWQPEAPPRPGPAPMDPPEASGR
jgi:hypothetical protein